MPRRLVHQDAFVLERTGLALSLEAEPTSGFEGPRVQRHTVPIGEWLAPLRRNGVIAAVPRVGCWLPASAAS